MDTVYLHYNLIRERSEEPPYSFFDLEKLLTLANPLVLGKNEVCARFPGVDISTRICLQSFQHLGSVDEFQPRLKAPLELLEPALDMFFSIAGIPKGYFSSYSDVDDIVNKVMLRYGHAVWYGSHMVNGSHPVRPIPKAVVVTI